MRRAREWTNALTRWCDAQPQMVSFTGRCLAHRAGIKQLNGAWSDALAGGAARARARREAMNIPAAGQAYYQQAELHRLRETSPRPRRRIALRTVRPRAAAWRRVAASRSRRPRRGRRGDPPRSGRDERAAQAGGAAPGLRRDHARGRRRRERTRRGPRAGELRNRTRARPARRDRRLRARSSRARGGRARARRWHRSGRRRRLAGARRAVRGRARPRPRRLACRALGDEDSAVLELDAARAAFEQLGAAPDVARVDSIAVRDVGGETHGLSGRELEVLRLVAAGKTNREIARARRQRAHRGAAPAEHLPQARRLVAHRCDRVRLRAPVGLAGARAWSKLTTRRAHEVGGSARCGRVAAS